MASHTGWYDAIVGLTLFTIFALPAAFFLPTFFTSLLEGLRELFLSLIWVIGGIVALVTLLAVALIGEKAVRRWKGEGPGSPTISTSQTKSDDAWLDHAKKREVKVSNFEEAAEKVIDKLETTGVGKLLRRKVRGSRKSHGGQKLNEGEGVELREMRGDAASTGIRRTPPPLPPR
ncbi:hypothetical protein JCM11641_006685 [Rhodosporidiobolus odoratus]